MYNQTINLYRYLTNSSKNSNQTHPTTKSHHSTYHISYTSSSSSSSCSSLIETIDYIYLYIKEGSCKPLKVVQLYILMILPSTLNVIRHLICGTNYNWLLNVNLICERVWSGAESGLLISILEKLNWFCLTCLTTLVLLM